MDEVSGRPVQRMGDACINLIGKHDGQEELVGLAVDKKYEAFKRTETKRHAATPNKRESDWVEIRAVVIGVILASFITVCCSTLPSYYITYFVTDDPRFENRSELCSAGRYLNLH